MVEELMEWAASLILISASNLLLHSHPVLMSKAPESEESAESAAESPEGNKK